MVLLKFIFVLLVCCFNPSPSTHAQDSQAGFISIDCGAPAGSYQDTQTGIRYISDEGLIDTGESKTISRYSTLELLQARPLGNVRSFPQGVRNCYTLRVANGNLKKYLIRGSFCYGDYDGKKAFAQFDLHLGVNYWRTINVINDSICIFPEFIHVPLADVIHICLVNTGNGIPFISTLELRPLNDTTIYQTSSGSLQFLSRLDYGNNEPLSLTSLIRYHDDIYDRFWFPYVLGRNTTTLVNTAKPDLRSQNSFKAPSSVMKTATTPLNNSRPLTLRFKPTNITDQYYYYFYFAEVEELQANQSRQFYIYLNGVKYSDKLITPSYTSDLTVFSTYPAPFNTSYEFSLRKIENSTLPPILNALEIYKVVEMNSLTDDKDAAAMMSIKSTYSLRRNWQGDPCGPQQYTWDGLKCSFNGSRPPRIISLNLSSTALVGDLAAAISNLTALETLDLSNNKLSGQLPDFLGELASLRTLNLKGNNFTGPIPSKLLDGTISLSVDDSLQNNYTDACQHGACKKKNNFIIPAVSVGALSVVLISLALLWIIKRKSQGKHGFSLETKKTQFTYSEIKRITKNFEKVIGRGGFGTVYHGLIGEKEVAVKMYSSTMENGFKELQSEADVLLNVHHKNLTSLIGYCIDGTHVGIIYEFMAKGDLRKILSDQHHVLSWLQRIQIALNAAEGLEYMHHSCKPPIVHRDVKSSNILLNEKLEAKIADFGMCRTFPNETVTHVSTHNIAGTFGYLDPRYQQTGRITERSDVYSFGIVLDEIITSKPAVITDESEYAINLAHWVSSILQQGDVTNVVDPTLGKEFDVDSANEFVQIASLCVSQDSDKRPTMTTVVSRLRACLAMESKRIQNSTNQIPHPQTDSYSSLDSSLVSRDTIEEEREEKCLNTKSVYWTATSMHPEDQEKTLNRRTSYWSTLMSRMRNKKMLTNHVLKSLREQD